MTIIDVAHIREQGQNMIVVPMQWSFGQKPSSEQIQIEAGLQLAANQAGLAGHVVTVWDAGGGRMAFRAPPVWQGFFSSINLVFVMANVNKRITLR